MARKPQVKLRLCFPNQSDECQQAFFQAKKKKGERKEIEEQNRYVIKAFIIDSKEQNWSAETELMM